MDPNLAILALSAVVIAAYVFDIAGRRFKLPSVVLLLASGIILRRVMDGANLTVPYLDDLLPILGTIGLVLIVLEGALDLKLTHDRRPLVLRTLFAAIVGFVTTMLAIAALLRLALDADWTRALLIACPFAVISSAVAIPSAASLEPRRSEFVVYESAFSDIIGVTVFAALLAAEGDWRIFALTLGVTSVLSIALGLGFIALLYVLLNKLTGHVKFLPIIFLLMILYVIGKFFHLAPLILVLAFGLLLNNTFLLRRFAWLKNHETEGFADDVAQFKLVVAEGAFFVRTYFFLLLGYNTELADFATVATWGVTAMILGTIYVMRLPLLAATARDDIRPLLWIAPRGLITVMLYLSLPQYLHIAGFPDGTVMLVVLLSAVVLMIGLRRAPPAAAQAPET